MATHLSDRMEAIASLVTKGSKLCDVGCDHGFLPIVLIERGVITEALAVDIAAGPLASAKKNIEAAGLTTQIVTRRSNGLLAVGVDEADCIVIAGMGGATMRTILSDGRLVARCAKELILQPQSEVKEFRAFLEREGYELLAEDMVLEDGKFYPMMKVRFSEERKNLHRVREADLAFGPMLLARRDVTLHAYMLRELRITRDVIAKLRAQEQTPLIAKRLQEMEAYEQLIDETIW